MTNKEKIDITIKKLENSQIEIIGEIEWEKVKKHRTTVLKGLCESLSISGFRKGHVPEDVVIKHVGGDQVLGQSAEKALQEVYPKILEENKIKAIGRPFITITKLAEGNPLGFKIVTSVMPEFILPDYKSIAKKINSKKVENEITEEEVKTAIKAIREQWSKFEILEKNKALNKSSNLSGEKNKKPINPQDIKVEESDLPEFNDKFIKKLSPEYKNVDDFKKKLKENMKKEKEMKNREKKRIENIEKILEKTEINVPEVIIESELKKMMFQFEEDLKRAKMDKKFYLANIKKTEEELNKEWRKGAEKTSKIQLILNKIAEEEKIKPDAEKVEQEVEHIKQHHKEVNEDRARIHVEGLIVNEMVMEFLGKQQS